MTKALVAIVTIAALAGCAAQPALEPGKMLIVEAQGLSPFKSHEECARLEAGDRIEYSWQARTPLNFNIHYHEGKAVIMPLTRDNVHSDSGDFKALTAQDYCLMWEAGAQKTVLDYRVRLVRDKN